MTLSTTNFEAKRQALIISGVIRIVAKQYGFTAEQLTASGRGTQKLSDARHLAMTIARDKTSASFPDLAAAFGRKDHESARRAREVVDDLLIDPAFAGLAASSQWQVDEWLREPKNKLSTPGKESFSAKAR